MLSAEQPGVIDSLPFWIDLYNIVAALRSSVDKYVLREDFANPSCSRTIGTPIIFTGKFKSKTILRIMANCCASFSPKYAFVG